MLSILQALPPPAPVGVIGAVSSACDSLALALVRQPDAADQAARVIISVAAEVANNPHSPRVDLAVNRALQEGLAPTTDSRHGVHGRNETRTLRYVPGALELRQQRVNRRKEKGKQVAAALRLAASADDGGASQRRVDHDFLRLLVEEGPEPALSLEVREHVDHFRRFPDFTEEDVDAASRTAHCSSAELLAAVGAEARRKKFVSIADNHSQVPNTPLRSAQKNFVRRT